MNLIVLRWLDLLQHDPKEDTYVIRIFSSWEGTDVKKPLIQSPNYKHIVNYTFDDNEKNGYVAGSAWFNDEMAKEMLTEFKTYKDRIACLITSCMKGKNRSPAVALAMNEVFGLGQNSDEMREKYPALNVDTYETLKNAAEKHHLSK